MKIVNVQGRKKTGKTTTVTNIIAELCRRGYSVGSVKGIHIDDFTMDSENEDTGKHKKAGADPVTARCHGETNIMYKGKMNLRQILKHYDNDWVVIESHVDLNCPNVITGRTAEHDGEGRDVSLAEQVNDLTIACSGIISNEIDEFRGIPVINATTDIERLVDLIEEKSETARPMQLSDNHEADELLETNRFRKITSDGSESDGSDSMLVETNVEIWVNEEKAGITPCTPQNIVELVIGWINSEGYINGPDDIDSISLSEDGERADILVKPYTRRYNPVPVRPIEWNKEWIFRLAEDFEVILPLRRETMAAHNCRIARGSSDGGIDILYRCEDIGRHSAIDKAVGWAIRNRIDVTDCVLFTSGRVSRAMVQKVIRAGIPVMAGKGTISKSAVKMAEENSLTLIGYSNKDSICIFTEPKQEKQNG